jgi:hypothetical protein
MNDAQNDSVFCVSFRLSANGIPHINTVIVWQGILCREDLAQNDSLY